MLRRIKDMSRQEKYVGIVFDIFDWDYTLGPRTANQLMQMLGEQSGQPDLAKNFNAEVKRRIADWESDGQSAQEALVVNNALFEWMLQGKMPPYTLKLFKQLAPKLLMYAGVEHHLLPDSRHVMAYFHPKVAYATEVLTAGTTNLLRETDLYRSGKLDGVDGTDYRDPLPGSADRPPGEQRLTHPKRLLVQASLKVQYLKELFRRLPGHVIIENMYTGDSETDLDAWRYLTKRLQKLGVCIAVSENRDGASYPDLKQLRAENKLHALCRTDYQRGSIGYRLHIAYLHRQAQIVEARAGLRITHVPFLEDFLDDYETAVNSANEPILDAEDIPLSAFRPQVLAAFEEFEARAAEVGFTYRNRHDFRADSFVPAPERSGEMAMA